jgi:hypothetical protein
MVSSLAYPPYVRDSITGYWSPRIHMRIGGGVGLNGSGSGFDKHWLQSFLPFEFIIGQTPLSNPITPIITCITYLLIVFAIKQYMKDRKPFDLKNVRDTTHMHKPAVSTVPCL